MKQRNDPFSGIDCVKGMSLQDKEELLREALDTLEVEEVEPSIFMIWGSDFTSFLLVILSFYLFLYLLFRIVTESFL